MRIAAFVCVIAACAEPALVDDEVEVGEDDKADADSELRVRTGDTTVWVDRWLAREGDTFAMRGRASRTVTDGTGFVFDDPYGDFAKRGARSFELTWPVSTARGLVDGVNQFVRLSFAHSNGRPDTLTARAVVRPRFSAFTGSSRIYLTAELTPVVVAGEVVYRAKGRTTSANTRIDVTIDGAAQVVRRVDGTHFEIDLAPDAAFAIAGVDHSLLVAAELATGQVESKQARLGVSLKKLALTAGDVYERFPRPDCDGPTKSCLTALPDGALDLGGCGEAVVVQSCAGKVGVFADDVAIVAAIARGTQLTSSPAFHTDATGIVGAARVDQLQGGAEQTIDDRATRLFGRWLLSATARTAVLDTAVDGAILAAYTHPLDLVEPIHATPGNVQSIRDAAADGLLAELAVHDFLSTEYARTYDTLVGQFRDRHVDSIREMRETATVEPHYAFPERDVVIGRWLDAYVEVSVVRATGVVANVFIEID